MARPGMETVTPMGWIIGEIQPSVRKFTELTRGPRQCCPTAAPDSSPA